MKMEEKVLSKNITNFFQFLFLFFHFFFLAGTTFKIFESIDVFIIYKFLSFAFYRNVGTSIYSRDLLQIDVRIT